MLNIILREVAKRIIRHQVHNIIDVGIQSVYAGVSVAKIRSNLTVTEYGPGGTVLSKTWDGIHDGKWIDIYRDSDGNVIDVDLTGFTPFGTE